MDTKQLRTYLNLKQRLDIAQELENGKSKQMLARRYKVSYSTIKAIQNQKLKLVNACKNLDEDTLSTTFKIKSCITRKLDMAVLRYYRQSISCKKTVNGKILLEKAGIFANMLSLENFMVDERWFSAFKRRYRLVFSKHPKFLLKKAMKFLSDQEIINAVGKDVVKDDENFDDFYHNENDEETNWVGTLPNDTIVNNDEGIADDYQSQNDGSGKGENDPDETSNNWMKNIKMTVIKCEKSKEDEQPVIEALNTVQSALNNFDIVPSEIYNAFNFVQDYIVKQLSEN